MKRVKELAGNSSSSNNNGNVNSSTNNTRTSNQTGTGPESSRHKKSPSTYTPPARVFPSSSKAIKVPAQPATPLVRKKSLLNANDENKTQRKGMASKYHGEFGKKKQ